MRQRMFIGLLLVLSGCRAAPVTRSILSNGFPSELAQPATSLPASALATVPSSASPSGASSSSSASSKASSRATASATGSFTQRAAASDPAGDQGVRAPVYADLIRLAIESDGTNVRVAVTVHGTIPNPTPASEQMAIGVDLFRSQDAVESEYQLYASGNDAGWSAFLDTPDGFVRYPGTLQIGGDRLVFTVPWSSVGGLRRGFTRAFLDWDRKGAVLSDTGEDHAPDSSKLSYD